MDPWYYYGDDCGPDPIRAALKAIVGKAPPKWVKGYDTNGGSDKQRSDLQDWVNTNARPFWSTGIGILEAAEHIVQEAVSNANIPPAEFWKDPDNAPVRKSARPKKIVKKPPLKKKNGKRT